MPYVTIEEMIARAEKFEEKLEQYYASIRDETKDNGARLLTYYLAKHRRHLQEALKSFTTEEIAIIKKSRLKYDVEFDPEKAFHLMKTPPREVKGQELLEAAVEYDTKLVSFYKNILQQPLNEEARQLVTSFIRLEEKDIVMLKKMIAMDYF